jgi:hypothetical protein
VTAKEKVEATNLIFEQQILVIEQEKAPNLMVGRLPGARCRFPPIIPTVLCVFLKLFDEFRRIFFKP